jgi:hypothetical protein
LMSGSDNVNKNQQFIAHFAGVGTNDSILIITGNNTSLANQIKTKFAENDADAEIMQAIPTNANSAYFLGKVERIGKIVCVNNDYHTLMDFLENGAVGNLLQEHLLSGSKATAFIGGDSRYAGGLTLVNYDQQYASYDGLLEFDRGIGLLKSMIIMPKTFENSNIEENAAAGVPFGMLLDSLKYGIWLHDNTFAEYKVNSQNETTITSFGSYPMMLIESEGTHGDFSDQSAVNSGRPRNVAGFTKFNLSLMDESVVKILGYVSSVSKPAALGKMFVYPNPSNDFVNIFLDNAQDDFLLKIHSTDGRIVFQQMIRESVQLNVSGLPDGFYILTATAPDSGINYRQKLIIRR